MEWFAPNMVDGPVAFFKIFLILSFYFYRMIFLRFSPLLWLFTFFSTTEGADSGVATLTPSERYLNDANNDMKYIRVKVGHIGAVNVLPRADAILEICRKELWKEGILDEEFDLEYALSFWCYYYTWCQSEKLENPIFNF